MCMIMWIRILNFLTECTGNDCGHTKKTGYEPWISAAVGKQTTNSIYDSGNYSEKFERDITEADKNIVISSPDIQSDKVDRFIKITKSVQKRGVRITVITTEPDNVSYGNAAVCSELIHNMECVGIHVILKSEVSEHFAVIDDILVWHGGMNLLGKEDVWDNLIRIKNQDAAAELLEMAMKEI